jgi:hypothetical protein
LKSQNNPFPLLQLVVAIALTASPGIFSPVQAQTRPAFYKGTLVHNFSREPVTFASIRWKKGGFGVISDSLGQFILKPSIFPNDSIYISFVGYKDLYIGGADLVRLQKEPVITMETAAASEGAIVKTKFNKGLRWWRQLVANKATNSPRAFNSYYCELYSKMEVDISNLDKKQFEKRKLLKPFGFVWKDMDSTSEDKPFLPAFLAESLSDFYVSHDPEKQREEVKAMQTSGIRNESVLEFMGGINQKTNTYDDYISLFGKEFISPVSAVGDKYYNYKGADTQVLNGEKYFHLLFSPRQNGENVFTGDCWIHSTSFALQKISLDLSATANINFVSRLSIVQEFTRHNGQWIVAKDKFVVSISPFNKDKLSFIGRKTSIYQKVQINQPFIKEKLAANKKSEERTIADTAQEQTTGFWSQQRFEPLTVNEQHAFRLVDTLRSLPEFKKLSNTVTFIVDGHKKLGKIEIGPWFRWISGNQLEKLRLRFDLGTTEDFSKDLRLYGYLAYGTKDAKFKGKAGASYNLPGGHGWNISPSYLHDLDNGKARFNDEDVTTDNMFSQLLRRQGIKQKFIMRDEMKLAVAKTFPVNFSIQASIARSDFETFHPLPPRKIFSLSENEKIINTEMAVKLRYAPGEKQIRTHRKVRALRSNLPVTELKYGFASPGILGGEYRYQKLNMNVTHRFRIPRWGQVTYTAYGGRIFGKQVPFMLLEIHPGNEIYYYSKDGFNLMNRFEYVSDRYAGLNIEHNLEKKLLNLLPFMRKSRIRQFWNVKTVWGDLASSNRLFNHIEFGSYHLRALKGNTYTEVGTGLENICKFFRIDLVWRFSPPNTIVSPNMPQQKFGVFGSFRLQF